eukprot:2103552-Pyramimonas_sp.AAC.1
MSFAPYGEFTGLTGEFEVLRGEFADSPVSALRMSFARVAIPSQRWTRKNIPEVGTNRSGLERIIQRLEPIAVD